jgi:hypothetical protein
MEESAAAELPAASVLGHEGGRVMAFLRAALNATPQCALTGRRSKHSLFVLQSNHAGTPHDFFESALKGTCDAKKIDGPRVSKVGCSERPYFLATRIIAPPTDGWGDISCIDRLRKKSHNHFVIPSGAGNLSFFSLA